MKVKSLYAGRVGWQTWLWAAKTYANCTKLNMDYPHGVGKPGARDKTSGTPVTNFKRSKKLYNANSGSDRDGDGIACEKA